MPLFNHLVQAIVSLVIIYVLAIILRNKEILKEDHSLIFAKIVTDLCLPAMIFINLAKVKLTTSHLKPALLMLGSEIICILLAWSLCKILKLSKEITGPIVFCSAFGSSAFLGYSIILELYPSTPDAITEAVLIAEIGVGYPIFILGPLLATFWGNQDNHFRNILKDSLSFFRSPIFFALLLGVFWQPLGLPGANHLIMAPIFSVGSMLSQALTPLAILSVGLMFKVPKLKSILIPLIIMIAIKLFIKPVGIGIAAETFHFSPLWKEVLVLLSAMPPAILGAVFLRRYNGNAALASALLLSGTLLSSVSILIVFYLVC